jgi:hypothetical protein
MIGIQAEGFRQLGNGFVDSALRPQKHPQVEMRFGILGSDLYGPREMRERTGEIPVRLC